MTLPRSFPLSLFLLLAGCLPAMAQEVPPQTTLDGVYTPEQATEGREVYVRVCSACHVLDYYTGAVVEAWAGASVFDLYDLIRTKMPEDNPGSLRSREYVAVLAYILEINGMPPGEEALSARRSILQNILFQWRDGT